MLRLKRSICWVYLTVFTQAGFAMYCEKEFSPRNVTGRVLSFCTINMKHDTVAIYLEVSGLEDHRITCGCTLALVDENTKSNLGYELVQETIDGSEIRVGNVVAPPNPSAQSITDDLYNTTLTFSKTTGTSKMCLWIVSGARFNVDCMEAVYHSSDQTSTSTVSSVHTPSAVTLASTPDEITGDGSSARTTATVGSSEVTSGNDSGVIAGAVVGGCVIIVAVSITIFICIRKRPITRQKSKETEGPETETHYYLNENIQYENAVTIDNNTIIDANDRDTVGPDYTTLVQATKSCGNYSALHFPTQDSTLDVNDSAAPDNIMTIAEAFIESERNKV